MLGPQEAPEYVTEEDVQLLLSTTFKVSEKASRLGIAPNTRRLSHIIDWTMIYLL